MSEQPSGKATPNNSVFANISQMSEVRDCLDLQEGRERESGSGQGPRHERGGEDPRQGGL